MAAASRSIAVQSQNELGNAFEEIAPSYDLPSNKLPYDIFINHRGPDVKETLATAIYNSLTADGLTVFLDSKELEGGDFLPKEIEEAMRRASLHIAIFSENYAQSPWCLAELSFMVKTATKIVPVFYHVQPTDLRLVAEGVGMYVNAFVEHAQKLRYSFEKLVEWNRALHHVSFYSGYIINCNEEEGNLLKNIVNIAMKMRKVPFEVARYPVGLDEAVEGFQNIFLESTQDHQNVQIMGIYGMGGSGKTTLAKELYNRKCSSFDRCSFIFEVRAAQNALHEKQNKLLWDVGIKDVKIDNVEDGRRILANRLRFVKVLIILDDVDHPNQIDALLPQRNNLASGSLIIVTSRDLSVLTRGRISSVYKTKGLDELNAEQLFCWHAFEKPFPPQEFEVLAKKFTDACDGLPLSIKVLGAQLCGISSTSSWESLLHKISRVLPRDIAGMLKISYDALDEEEQEAFLDIACFFLGEEKGLAIVLWDGLSWSGLHTWETLFNKCLVELDENNCIRMHDHLRDLGREIANRQPPYRLWSEEQIINVQKQSQERIRIRGITRPRPQWKSGYNRFPPHSSDGKVVINTSEGYCGVTPSSLGLKFFDARGHYFEQEIAELSTELVWLRWYKHGQRNLPSRLSLKNLRILELYEADDLEELWEAYVDPPLELRELIIGSRKFQKFPSSIGHLNNLKKIIVVGAYRSNEALTRLPCHFCSLSSLEHLELKCENLSELPSGFGHLKHLRHLVLRHCKELRNLPVSFKHLTLLQHLELYECGKLTIEMDILENMTKLEYLNFSGCGQLEELPSHITNQAFLKELHLQGTRLKELPSNIGQLGKLKRLKLGGPLFSSGDRLLTSLPTSIGNLSCLRDLLISAFTELEYLPETFMDMTNLETLSITWCPIRELGLGRRSYSHSSLRKLKMINLWNTNVYKISIFEDCCPSIETLDAMFNHHLTEIETLPTSMKFLKVHSCKVLKNIKGIRDLVNLQKLQIFACPELEVLPSFERLTCLKEFNMEDCGKVQKIQGLEHCRSLKTLCIYLKVFGIESLKYQEELSRLELYVDGNILSVEPYTQTMQKWPPEMIICGRKVPGVKSFVNSLPFSGLTTVEPVVEVRTHWLIGMKRRKFWILRCPVMDLDDAAMVCFVINCSKDNVGLSVQTGRFRDCYSMRLGRGKWVWLCVLTQIDFHELEKFEMEEQDCQVEMGILMMGQQRKVADALYQLFKYENPTTNNA